MMGSVMLNRLSSRMLTCSRGSCVLTGRMSSGQYPHSSGHMSIQPSLVRPLTPKITPVVWCSTSATEKYNMIYRLPHIKLLRAVSRLKLLQTAFTVVILPPVYIMYLHGGASLSVVSYSTGLALFAGAMLYVASNFFRRVVGMMYLNPTQTTLKVSHLTFWGKRNDVFLPVSDVMTIEDTGDSVREKIMKLKTYNSPQTFYFSIYFGHVLDKEAFAKVFGSLK